MLDRDAAIQVATNALINAGLWRTVGDHEPKYILKTESEISAIVVDAINKASDA